MAENAIDHSLGGSDTARIIAHSTFLPAGTGRGEFKRILTGAADRQILFEIVGKDRRQLRPRIYIGRICRNIVAGQPLAVARRIHNMKCNDFTHGFIKEPL